MSRTKTMTARHKHDVTAASYHLKMRGVSWGELAELFGYPASTLASWVKKYAHQKHPNKKHLWVYDMQENEDFKKI